MSLRRPLINAYLRLIEKPRMAKVEDPRAMRRAFEFQARWLFRRPAGTRLKWGVLKGSRAVPTLRITPRRHLSDGVIFYVHGGAFLFGSPRTHMAMVAELCRDLSARAVLPRYRLAPEHPFPAAVEDIRAAWDGLMAEGVPPSKVVLGGDSAGATLALGLLAELCQEGAPRPAAVFCLSPLTDMTHSGASFYGNQAAEAILANDRARVVRELYLGNHPPEDPRASPLHAEFPGAPPVWITVGDTEILQDDASRMAVRLRSFHA
ncbi:MAG: alpha/beta hydrolase, partial [Sulfitobacter sp.]|nr:alpha/beta hydrolase [Sulfitobacter sp.]